MPRMSIRVSVAQFGATVDKVKNLSAVQALISEAGEAGAELIVLPENSMYSNPDATADISAERESLDGPFAAGVAQSAKEHNIAVIVGMTEVLDHSHKAFNTVVAFGPDGERTGIYRKVHLYDAFGYKESDRVQAAEFDPLTIKLGDLTFGIMTCYDLRFPEISRALIDAGSDVLVVPAAWVVGPAKEDHWITLCRARAIENTAYAIVSGQTGPNCAGQSMVIDPMGVVAASAGEAPGIAVTTISRERIESVRLKNPSLVNRRFSVAPI
jgi:deaminated glutathione amidase